MTSQDNRSYYPTMLKTTQKQINRESLLNQGVMLLMQHYIEPFIQQLNTHLLNPDNDALSALQRYFNELITELEKAEFKGGCLLGI